MFRARLRARLCRGKEGLHGVPTFVRQLSGYTHNLLLFLSSTHFCPLFHPLLSEIYPLVTTLIHSYFPTATTILPPIRRLSAASTMFPRKPGILRGVIPDGTTTRETGSNCSWALVLVLQQNSTEKLNGHWWWCAPAADPHQKIFLFFFGGAVSLRSKPVQVSYLVYEGPC